VVSRKDIELQSLSGKMKAENEWNKKLVSSGANDAETEIDFLKAEISELKDDNQQLERQVILMSLYHNYLSQS